MTDLTIGPRTSERWPALEDLFGKAGASNGCWCMYWRLGPRCHERARKDNRRDRERLAASGRPPGLLAFDRGTAVGWCELAPRADLAWLAGARFIEPVDELPVWSVPCFWCSARTAVSASLGALIEAAVAAATAGGAPALEAYPVDTAVPGTLATCSPASRRPSPGGDSGSRQGASPAAR
jgi:hypothetical protein